MRLAELTSQVWAMTLPWVLGSMGVAIALLIVVFTLRRRREVLGWLRSCLQRRSQYPALFRQHLERLGEIRDPRELHHTILEAAIRISDAEGASLLVRDEAGVMQVRAVSDLPPLGFDMAPCQPFLEALRDRRAFLSRDCLHGAGQRNDALHHALRYFVQFNCEACVPLHSAGELIGVLNLGTRKKGFDREMAQAMEFTGQIVATALQNAQLHERLTRQNMRLSELSQLKDHLLDNVSHELRTPLNSVIGLSEMLSEGISGPVTAEQTEHLQAIHQAGVKLTRIINTMLELSKLESHQQVLAVHRIDIRKLIDEVMAEQQLGETLTLQVNLPADMPRVYGDETRIREVFRHLLENAVKFTKRGKITIQAARSGEMLTICVRDTGIGMTPEQCRRVFESFAQADDGLAREYPGVGLGLALAQRIIALHGGRMWVVSKPSRGSSFYFTLPVRAVAVKHPEIAASA